MPSLIDLMLEGRKVEQHGPWPRAVVDASIWQFADQRTGAGTLEPARPVGRTRRRCTWRSWMNSTAEIAVVSLDCPDRSYPSVGEHHPPALRLERTVNDLFGLAAEGLPDHPPLARSRPAGACVFRWADRIDAPPKPAPYRFLPAEGDGLHQIAVGPVHAGIIEPGHFRFTASGETVVRLEQRLGYTHKGIEGLMAGASLERAVQLAGRVSGDSTVAYAYAFSRAGRSGAWNWWCPIARSGCARCSPNSSGSPTISATSARSATMPPSP